MTIGSRCVNSNESVENFDLPDEALNVCKLQAADLVLPIRILHLPMAFNEGKTHAAIQKYTRSVRSEAPYLPSNVDFLAANNGLATGAQGVAKVVFEASYMVLGLGDVYLGAPCAVPVDPR